MLTFSQKLFLKINSYIGKNKLRDTFFYFCGQWLIWVLVIINVLLFPVGLYTHEMFGYLCLFFLSAIIAYGISFFIALRFKHPRPIVEFPNIKELIIPLGTWKSFPSDHTIGAVLLSTSAYFLSGGSTASLCLFIFLAVLVMFGRIYCGVHYPRDIVGGIVVAMFSIGVSVLLYVWYVTQLVV